MATPPTPKPSGKSVALSIDPAKLENFRVAFSSHHGSCRSTCECGREFYDAVNRGYSWEAGELEALIANPSATGLDYTVDHLVFQGKEYVASCDCWFEKADMLMRFLDSHLPAIAEYSVLEKRREQSIADRAVIVPTA